jgi:hypothetical protein
VSLALDLARELARAWGEIGGRRDDARVSDLAESLASLWERQSGRRARRAARAERRPARTPSSN